MVRLIFALAFIIGLYSCSPTETIFELSPQQSMSITGKGPGQDAAFNPYSSTKSIAKVQSLGVNPFTIRVQFQGEVISTTHVMRNEEKEVILEPGYELYLDSELSARAKVEFHKF